MHLPEPTGSFELAPEGTFLGVCYRVIDMGTQESSYNGETKRNHKVMISWELPNERMDDGRPFSIHQMYTLSMHEKATLRKHLESWRGRKFEANDFGVDGFNIKKLLGAGCLLTVTHSTKGENTYSNLTGVAKMMKGMEAPPPENETLYFSMEDESTFNSTCFVLDKVSGKLAERIRNSPEYRNVSQPNGHSYRESENPGDGFEMDDDIPF